MLNQRKIISVCIVLVLVMVGFCYGLSKTKTAKAQAGWWNSSWGLRMRVNITSGYTGGSLSNAPMLVKLTNGSSGFYFSDAASGGSDVRFIDSNGSTILDHEIESWNVNNKAYIWVSKPSASSGGYIYMYYDGPSGSYEDSEGVWDSDYKIVHHLNETSEPHYDSTTYDNDENSSYSNVSTMGGVSTAKIGGADEFDGTDNPSSPTHNYDKIWLDSDSSYEGGNKLTFEAWIYPRSAGDSGNARIIEFRQKFFGMRDGGTNISGGVGASTQSAQASSYGTWVTLNAWNYVVMRYDDTDTREVDLFVNAQEVDYRPWDYAAAEGTIDDDSGDGFCIGNEWYEGRTFDGFIDELRMSKTDRSNDWINFQYCSMNQTCISYNSVETGNTSPTTPTSLSQSPGAEGSWTNDSTPYFNFTISDPNAGDTVGYQIQIDNNSDFSSPTIDYTWAGSTTNPNGVTYTVPVGSALANGTYYWRVRAKDGSGAYSGWADDSNGFASSGADFRVDTTNPTVSNAQARCDSYVDSCETDNDTTIYFTWSSSDSGGSGLADCWAEIGDSTPDESAGTDGQDTDTGTEGLNTYYVRCQDNAGNYSSIISDTITISLNQSPNTPTALSQSPGAEGAWTNDNTPYFSFTISDPNAGDTVGYQIQIDNNSDFSSPTIDYTWSGSTTNPNSVTYTVPVGSALANGTYYWRVRAKDGSGAYSGWADDNSGFASSGADFRVDTTNPTCGSVTYDPNICTNNNVDVRVGCSDSGSGCTQTSYLQTVSSNSSGNITIQDNAGNTRSCAYNVTNIDKTAPTITTPVTSSSSSCETIRFSINGASDAGCAGLHTTPYSFNGGSTWQAANYKDYTGTSYTIAAGQIKVKDSLGNIYTYSSPVSGTALPCNTSPNTPTSLSQSPGAEGSWTNDSTPSFDFSVLDPDSGDTVGYQIQIDNNSDFSSVLVDFEYIDDDSVPPAVDFNYQVPDICPGSGYTVCDGASVPLPDGTYYWRVRAKDGSGAYSGWADDNSGFASSGADFGVDVSAPSVTSLSVNYVTFSEQPLITNDTTPTIYWTSQDNGSSDLKQIEVWRARADDSGGTPTNWQPIKTLTTGVGSGNWSDSVSLGTYWYGVHVSDNCYEPSGYNCITEDGTHCDGVGSDSYDPRTIFGPIEVRVISGQSPAASFDYCELSGNYVYFTDLSSDADGTIESWDWEFGDGNVSSEQNPIHQYALESVYEVVLEVTDDDGLTDTTSSSIDLSSAASCSYLFLASVSVDCDTIGLAWDAAVGANSYEIYRSVNGSGYALLTTKSSAAACTELGCSYDDATVSEGNVYAYYLRAITSYHGYNNSTSSPNPVCSGDEDDICPLADITPLCYPDNFQISSTACGSISLDWESVTGAESYQLEKSLNNDGPFTQIGGGNLAGTTYVDQEIILEITYYYRIRSVYPGPEYSEYTGPVSGDSFCYQGIDYSED